VSAVSKRLALIVLACVVLAAGGYYLFASRGASPLAAVQAWFSGSSRPAAPAAPAQPPPEVAVMEVRPAEVPLPVEYAGRVIGFRDVEVRPRVGGLLLQREFEEGSRVKEGQVLFRIDPATYQVAQSRAEAGLAQVQAALRQAEENLQRIEELFRRGAAAENQRDDAIAARDQARAGVQLAEAEVNNARLNVEYTTVTAPVGGITSVESPPIGTLVQAQQTLLSTITQLDPAYVSFSFTDEENRSFRALNQNRLNPISERDLTVELQYGDGAIYPEPGRIDTAAQRVDPQTGTIQARAVFPNPEGALLPGQFVRVVVRGVTLPDAIVVPERAVSQGPQGPSVFVIGENNVAQARPIRLGQQVAAGWIVPEGLKAGDHVVVDGLMRVRPGAPVRPVPADAMPVPAAATPSFRDSGGNGGGNAAGQGPQAGSPQTGGSSGAGGRPEATGSVAQDGGGRANPGTRP
jgi:membrane fusion protein (multidrug efflux system)